MLRLLFSYAFASATWASPPPVEGSVLHNKEFPPDEAARVVPIPVCCFFVFQSETITPKKVGVTLILGWGGQAGIRAQEVRPEAGRIAHRQAQGRKSLRRKKERGKMEEEVGDQRQILLFVSGCGLKLFSPLKAFN